MVIKRFWELRGESAFGDRPASSTSKFSAGVTSGLRNGSFWVEILDVKHVDQCSWRSTPVWSHQMTSDLKRCLLFWKCLQVVVSERSFGASVLNGRPAGLHRDRRLLFWSHKKMPWKISRRFRIILISFRIILISFRIILISFRIILISFRIILISFRIILISFRIILISFRIILISFRIILISFRIILISFRIILISQEHVLKD